jgi:hypothetical protein
VFAGFSLRRESPDLDPRRRTPHFWGGSVIAGIRARSGLITHSKDLKITTSIMVRTLIPYKDYSSLLRWQANICVHIATTELHQRRYVVVFRVFVFFSCWWLILLFVALVELLGLWMSYFIVYEDFCFLWVACWTCSGYEGTGLLGAWVGMKVLDPLRACVKVGNCCDPSSTCTLTCVKMCVECIFATVP